LFLQPLAHSVARVEAGLYLVERYLPSQEVAETAERVDVATRQMSSEGTAVRYLSTTYVPGDETCFCEFEAPSREVVEQVNERANAPYARILPAVRISTRGKGE
jgi:hypothetical protein